MQQKRFKVLFISSWYPNRNAPTYGIFIKRHAEAVSLSNEVTSLYVCSEKDLPEEFAITESSENGIDTVIVYYRKVASAIPFFSQWLKFKRYLKGYRLGYERVLKKMGKPDIVHCNILFPAGLMALWLKKNHSIPYIVTENWTGYLPSDGSYKGAALKYYTTRIAGNASMLTPVSADLQQAMHSHGFTQPSVIVPNVVDTSLFFPAEKKGPNSKKTLIHVSALDDKQKNISGILRCISKVFAERQDFVLNIIGDGPDRKALEKLANHLGILGTAVQFKGLMLREQLAAELRNSDAFVLFSNYENLPCVLIEALASGIPVIATRIGGTPEHITGKLGMLIEPGDEPALADAIREMLNTCKSYDSNHLRNYATEQFSYANVGKQFHLIYEKVLKG